MVYIVTMILNQLETLSNGLYIFLWDPRAINTFLASPGIATDLNNLDI